MSRLTPSRGVVRRLLSTGEIYTTLENKLGGVSSDSSGFCTQNKSQKGVWNTKVTQCVGIIGTGNLGQSLANMIINGEREIFTSLICSVRRSCRRDQLERLFLGDDVEFMGENAKIAQKADCVLISVKPWQVKGVCSDISEIVDPGTPVISTAAAVPLAKLQEWLPHTNVVIRCMPNIPCSIGQGVVPYISNKNKEASSVMGDVFSPNVLIPLRTDSQIDASTLISGCGPALLAWYTNCIKELGEDIIADEDLNTMIIQTMVGTAGMLQHTPSHDILLNTASPKGATETTLRSFQTQGVEDIIHQSLISARDRINSMSETL